MLSFFSCTVFKYFFQPPQLVASVRSTYIKRDAEWHIPRTYVGVTIKFSRFVVEINILSSRVAEWHHALSFEGVTVYFCSLSVKINVKRVPLLGECHEVTRGLPSAASKTSPYEKSQTVKQKKSQTLCVWDFGDPYENRTRVTAVKGRCLNRLTNGPKNGSGSET